MEDTYLLYGSIFLSLGIVVLLFLRFRSKSVNGNNQQTNGKRDTVNNNGFDSDNNQNLTNKSSEGGENNQPMGVSAFENKNLKRTREKLTLQQAIERFNLSSNSSAQTPAKVKSIEQENDDLKMFTVGMCKCYYLNTYYPKNKYADNNIPFASLLFRNSIYKFKDGLNEGRVIFLKRVIDAIKSITNGKASGDYVFCVIPASTKEKTLIRFEEFCKAVSIETGMINGFNFISNKVDRNDTRMGGGSKSVNKVSTLDFSPHLKGKDIILFDDITTTGNSFKHISYILIRMRARSVTGLFLGKTYYKSPYDYFS